MRSLILSCVSLAAMALTTPAFAGPVAIGHVSYSPEFQEKLTDDLGAREGDYLTNRINAAVARSLARHGATITPEAPVVVDVTIVDARPNRPTFEQASARPGLDMFRSISLGGAELRGVLRTRDGQTLAEVEHAQGDYTLDDALFSAGTWSEADRAIRRFAEKVGDAYEQQAR